jgi:acetyl esterase/lipase
VLLDDAVHLAERAKAAGVYATLGICDRMIHGGHWFLPMLDEAQTAVEAIGRFVRSRA